MAIVSHSWLLLYDGALQIVKNREIDILLNMTKTLKIAADTHTCTI